MSVHKTDNRLEGQRISCQFVHSNSTTPCASPSCNHQPPKTASTPLRNNDNLNGSSAAASHMMHHEMHRAHLRPGRHTRRAAHLGKQFCRSTSAHGFYKLVRQDNVCIRAAWMLIIAGAAAGFTVHLASLIVRYRELPVNTETKVLTTRFVFPDVTICSTNSFSRIRIKMNPIVPSVNLTFTELLNQTKNYWARGLNMSAKSNELNRDTINSLKSVLHEVNVTRQKQELLVHCHYLGAACSFLNFTQFTDPLYLSCHTFKPNERHLVKGGEKEGGLSVILYAGDSMNFITDEEALSFFKGVRVAVHPRNTRPNLKTAGFYAQNGFNTITQLGYTEVRILNKPSRTCMNFVPEMQFLEDSKDGQQVHNFSYTIDDCHIKEYQEYLRKTCDCISESLPVPAKMDGANSKNFCHRLGDAIVTHQTDKGGNTTFFKRSCHDESIDLIHQRTSRVLNCPYPCFTSQYSLRVTRASWPDEEDIVSRALKRAVQRTRKLASKYNYDLSVLDTMLSNFSSLGIQRDFLKLDVYAQSKMGNVVEETWAYPVRNLFSDLGGILGLWLGVSIITLFEFFELAFCYSVQSILASRQQSNNPDLKSSADDECNRWQICADSIKTIKPSSMKTSLRTIRYLNRPPESDSNHQPTMSDTDRTKITQRPQSLGIVLAVDSPDSNYVNHIMTTSNNRRLK